MVLNCKYTQYYALNKLNNMFYALMAVRKGWG